MKQKVSDYIAEYIAQWGSGMYLLLPEAEPCI